MKQYSHVFLLDSQEKIIIFSSLSIDKLHCCNNAITVFLYKYGYYILSTNVLHEDLYKFCIVLAKVLKNQLTFYHAEKDIGYLENENWIVEVGIPYPELSSYSLWASLGNPNPKVDAWMYNDVDGSIIFKGTPQYPWLFEGAEQEKDYVPYDVWIQNYKPYFVRTISHKTAEQWLEQAQKMLHVIEENIKKEFNKI